MTPGARGAEGTARGEESDPSGAALTVGSMSDPPSLPSALGIEAVHWVAQDSGATVRVQGRWRRRRLASGGQALLVIESSGARQRFPAMPEPPAITGAAPGTWQLSFSVPTAFAPPNAERAWLQMGAVVVPLAVPVETERDPAPPTRPEEVRQEDPPARPGSLALQGVRRSAADAENAAQELHVWIAQLEDSLREARREPDLLRVQLTTRERALRRAEQDAHAERERRLELEQELLQARRSAQAAEADEQRQRVAELEAELELVQRAVDESEHALRAATVARERAERALRERPAAVADQAAIRMELALLRRALGRPLPGRARVPPAAGFGDMLASERAMVARVVTLPSTAAPDSGAALEDELAPTLAALRDELAQLRSELAREVQARRAAEERASTLEEQLRQHLARSARAHGAIDALRAELEVVRAQVDAAARLGVVPPSAAPAPAASEVGPAPAAEAAEPSHRLDPDRLSQALSRLRESAPAPEGQDLPPDDPPVEDPPPGDPPVEDPPPGDPPVEDPPPEGPSQPRDLLLDPPVVEPRPPAVAGAGPADSAATGPWLERVLRSLLRSDAGAAGELLLALLPAQHLAYPRPIAYDLVLAPDAIIHVTVRGEGPTEIDIDDSLRPPAAVDAQIHGDLPQIARLLVSRRLRRAARFGVARLRGERRALEALRALARIPLSVGQLYDAGVRTDPLLSLAIAAAMIHPRQTAGHRFTVAYQRPGHPELGPYLRVAPGSATAREAAPAPVPQRVRAGHVTLSCAPGTLLAALAGDRGPVRVLDGQPRLLELLADWLAQAQRP